MRSRPHTRLLAGKVRQENEKVRFPESVSTKCQHSYAAVRIRLHVNINFERIINSFLVKLYYSTKIQAQTLNLHVVRYAGWCISQCSAVKIKDCMYLFEPRCVIVPMEPLELGRARRLHPLQQRSHPPHESTLVVCVPTGRVGWRREGGGGYKG